MEGRTYGDPCGVARALDAVGERWALLVVRELLLGPKRFGDLHRGLAGISQNVLSQRLRELEAAGVVGKRRLGPPAATQVYELTEEGATLEPVLLALGDWGRHRPVPAQGDGGELSVDALMLALKTTFDPARAGDLNATVNLQIGDDEFTVAVSGGALAIERGNGNADTTLRADPTTVRELAFGDAHSDDVLVQRLFDSFAKRQPAKR